MQKAAADDLRRLVTEKLAAAGLAFARAECLVTPRRLALSIEGLPLAQQDLSEERRGPRVGAPAPALEGFLKSAGLATLAECEERDTGKGNFYFAVIRRAGPADRSGAARPAARRDRRAALAQIDAVSGGAVPLGPAARQRRLAVRWRGAGARARRRAGGRRDQRPPLPCARHHPRPRFRRLPRQAPRLLCRARCRRARAHHRRRARARRRGARRAGEARPRCCSTR